MTGSDPVYSFLRISTHYQIMPNIFPHEFINKSIQFIIFFLPFNATHTTYIIAETL